MSILPIGRVGAWMGVRLLERSATAITSGQSLWGNGAVETRRWHVQQAKGGGSGEGTSEGDSSPSDVVPARYSSTLTRRKIQGELELDACFVQWQSSKWIQQQQAMYLLSSTFNCFCFYFRCWFLIGVPIWLGASQAMLYATGLQEEDMLKPQVSLALFKCNI